MPPRPRTPEQNTFTRPLWFELKETLTPGNNCTAFPMYWDHDDNLWKPHTTEVTIYDPHKLNFGLDGEVFEAQAKTDNARIEIIGSKGLLRKAKNDAAINAGSSGDCSIYTNGSDSSVNVTGHLNWAASATNLSINKEIFVQWFVDEEKWVIVGRECE